MKGATMIKHAALKASTMVKAPSEAATTVYVGGMLQAYSMMEQSRSHAEFKYSEGHERRAIEGLVAMGYMLPPDPQDRSTTMWFRKKKST